MVLSLINYASALPKGMLTAIKKCKVRECDEEVKGRYVAYVDEGKNSYDVSITVLPNGDVDGSECECGSGQDMCVHRVALLVHVAEGKKVKATIKGKKKSETDSLLDEVGFVDLREWLRGVMLKNKEVELAFVNRFVVREQLKPEDVVKLVKSAIKAAGANKKSVDVSQLKKVVELWSNVLEPVMQYYYEHVTDEAAFKNIHTAVEEYMAYNGTIKSTSTKVVKFVDSVLEAAVPHICAVTDETHWKQAVGYITAEVIGDRKMRMWYLLLVKAIAESSGADRKKWVTDKLVKLYKYVKGHSYYDEAGYRDVVFGMVVDNDYFGEYYTEFEPVRYANDYNLQLIGLLIEHNHTELAKGYCKAQIMLNYQEVYNIPYQEHLRTIYKMQGDKVNEAKMAALLLPHTYDFEDYLTVMGGLEVDERKKWHTKVMSRATNAAAGDNAAMRFCFKLLDHEKRYRKMIDYIRRRAPYDLIIQYFVLMAGASKDALLNEIMLRDDYSYTIGKVAEKNLEYYEQMYELVIQLYGADYIKMYIAQQQRGRYYISSSRFLSYVTERMKVA